MAFQHMVHYPDRALKGNYLALITWQIWRHLILNMWKKKRVYFFCVIDSSCRIIILFEWKEKFKKRVDYDPPIDRLSCENIKREIDDFPDLTFGSKCHQGKSRDYGFTHHWAKKKYFLRVAVLEYKLDLS